MGIKIQVLILEDNASDAELMQRELRKAGFDIGAECAQDKRTFLQALDHFVPDIILADYSLPGFDGLAALALARQRLKEIPVIIVSGAIGEEFAIETLKAGATDYVLKHRLSRLGAVVHRALQETKQLAARRRAEQAVLQAKQEWERTFDAVPDLIAILDEHHRILRVNRAMAQRLRMTPDQCVGKACYKAVHGLENPPAYCPHALTLVDGREHVAEVREDCLGGEFLVSTTPLADEQGRRIGSVHVARDINERKQMEESLRVHALELEHLTERLDQRVQERTAELARTNETLRQLSFKLLSAHEEERKRVAGDLHDSIGACLAGVKFKVEKALQQIAMSPSAVAESLKTIIPVVQESIDECRRIQADLRPAMLDDLGLLATLSWFCRRFQAIYSAIRVEQKVAIGENEIPVTLKTVAFRVIQEGLNNVAKHSQGDRVLLSLRRVDSRMELVIQDNGRGFNLEKARPLEADGKGLGLTSMRERTELSGGAFQIDSAEGQGTTIRAFWPLPENE